MGKRDYWTKWADQNKDYWAKWAQHNKNYWNNPQAQHYGRYMGRGRWLGRIVFFGLGFWAGSWANQRYRLPSANPREAWEDMRTATENVSKDHPGIRESPELNEILEKVKLLEKRYRRPRESDGNQPQASGEAQRQNSGENRTPPSNPPGPKSSE